MDLKSQFESTWKQYEDFTSENKQNHSDISNRLIEIHSKSVKINESNLASFKQNLEKERAIEEQARKQIDEVRNDVSSVLEKVNYRYCKEKKNNNCISLLNQYNFFSELDHS